MSGVSEVVCAWLNRPVPAGYFSSEHRIIDARLNCRGTVHDTDQPIGGSSVTSNITDAFGIAVIVHELLAGIHTRGPIDYAKSRFQLCLRHHR